MDLLFGTISYGVASFVYLIISIYIFKRYFRRNSDQILFAATFITAWWLGVQAVQSITGVPGFHIRYATELLRDLAWYVLLIHFLGLRRHDFATADATRRYLAVIATGLIISMAAITAIEGFANADIVSGKLMIIGQISVSLVGLILIEQVWRNSSIYGRSSLKHLLLAIAGIFGYDFFMYTDALLFKKMSSILWDTRGAVLILISPLIAITMINAKKQPIEVRLSRQVVFHSGALLITGVYLIFTAAGGYYIKLVGGSLGAALQILFVVAALLLLGFLMSSHKLRAKLMVYISQNFFNYKYDYRDEWLKSTRTLTAPDSRTPISRRAIQALGDLVNSNTGALWYLEEEHYTLRNCLNHPPLRHATLDNEQELIRYFKQNNWIIDLANYQADPTIYELVEIPDNIAIENAWLIIPLYLGEELKGIVVLAKPLTEVQLNWENFDLLKVVARQACSYLAQYDSQSRLSQSKQFDAVNKTSAFMVHDLKTMIAQLSLLVKNAQKHKSNPAFIEDMISTTSHTAEKMSYLLSQLQNPTAEETMELLDINKVLLEIISRQQKSDPKPVLDTPAPDNTKTRADPEKLTTVLGHIVQNAQDATDKNGEVRLSVKVSRDYIVIFIQDTGTGMSAEFIEHQLFKPFESTKGLTGMGIGAYQAREYIKKIGGSIDVTSDLGVGTCFSIRLPKQFK